MRVGRETLPSSQAQGNHVIRTPCQFPIGDVLREDVTLVNEVTDIMAYELSIRGTTIATVSSHKFLGVMLGQEL